MFDSQTIHHFARLAQRMKEQVASTQQVGSSSLPSGTRFVCEVVDKGLSRLRLKEKIESSNLSGLTRVLWRIRPVVRTPVFQAGYLGSNPGCATSLFMAP